MTRISITFDVDADSLGHFDDQYIAQLWHISQANPAPFGDKDACHFAEKVGREIIRRFVSGMSPELWAHQMSHVANHERLERNRLAESDVTPAQEGGSK